MLKKCILYSHHNMSSSTPTVSPFRPSRPLPVSGPGSVRGEKPEAPASHGRLRLPSAMSPRRRRASVTC